ncbi:hypothetical protein [Thalassospira marina]|nr:hypothetical protein [Thalassospira marina]
MKNWGIPGLAMLGTVLAGCSFVDQGAIDYHVDRSSSAGAMYLEGKYATANGGSTGAIVAGDTITLDLKQVFMKDFIESALFSDDKQGEIAIVANVFEMSDQSGRNAVDYGPNSVKSGRVIYYSDDVRPGQFLNLSQLPVYGPIRYNGNRLVIQLYILELDSVGSEAVSSLLKKLAELGGAAYPPASSTLRVLDSLGSALLQGNKNDTVFSYTMTLLPAQNGASFSEPAVLTAGNYVFVRKQERQSDFRWCDVFYAQSRGRLVVANPKPTDGKCPAGGIAKSNEQDENALPLFRDETYVVVQIEKGYDSISLDLQQATFDTLIAQLDAKTTSDIAAVEKVTDSYVASVRRINNYKDVKGMLQTLSQTGVVQAQAENAAFELMQIVGEAARTANAADLGQDAEPTLQEEDLQSTLRHIRLLVPTDANVTRAKIAPVSGGVVTVDSAVVDAIRAELVNAAIAVAPAAQADASAGAGTTAPDAAAGAGG